MPRSPEYARMVTILKEEGYRLTAPRRALLRTLADSTEPLSIQELHVAVNPKPTDRSVSDEDDINLVTVYRFANLLVDMGLARRVEFGQGYYRYEREEPQTGPHHHHIVCRQCGKVEDFHGCDLQDMTNRLETDTGYRIERHQLELFGVCPQCRDSPSPHAMRRTSGGRLAPTAACA